ncbi:sulfotransferase family 5A, member 1 [Synchiropus splendidus]|uniref:sulfotransferase family 5A, member 1 n=1 Tax=Synchiropus splendidus TaxID=270530 RepID=UPI00237EE972|nr:sulfotransferase family 5A, member 1 [Synchiropus splendidus]
MARLDVTETFRGISFPGHLHTQTSLQLALKFPFQDSDIVIVTYPKSGTTWMQQIVTLILNRGDPQVSQTVPNWARAPWLEQHYCAAVLESSPAEPRVITSHLPHHLLGPVLQGSNARVIYVSRNPKDVAASFYHFHKVARFLPEVGSFQDFLIRFLDGTLHFGSWFDHVKGWTSQVATMSNLLHITYEDMSRDLHGSIKKVSSFLQRHLLDEEVRNCVRHSRFSSMKDNKMTNYTLIDGQIMDHKKGCFMRKGEVGDWKNHFSEDQTQHFDSVMKSKMEGCSLEFIWEKEEGPE